MSVVNKMLQDLEARQTSTDSANADYHPPKRNVAKLVWIVILLAIVILAIMGGYYWSILQKNASNQAPDKPLASALLDDEPANAAQSAGEDMTLKKMVWIESDVAESSSPAADPADKKDASTEAPQTEPPIAREVSSAMPEATSSEPAKANVVPEKQATSDASAQPKAVFSKQTNKSSYAQAGLKQTINQALRDGKTLIAISGLQKLLSAEPENVRIRKKLASLLFAENRLQEAQALLSEGLAAQPDQHDLRLMLARLFAQQDSHAKALRLLLEVSPSMVLNSDYYAYRGALAQRMKNYAQAQLDYQALANAEPRQAKWWLGLGIAQDSSGDKIQALVSYRKADNEQQLSPQVITFVRQRLNDLVGIE